MCAVEFQPIHVTQVGLDRIGEHGHPVKLGNGRMGYLFCGILCTFWRWFSTLRIWLNLRVCSVSGQAGVLLLVFGVRNSLLR